MTTTTRESRLNAAFVSLADTLTDDYDVVDLLDGLVTECVGIVGVAAGGLMLADTAGRLQLVASTGEDARLVELMQLAGGSGPCIDCFTSGVVVSLVDMSVPDEEWPVFRNVALERGFRSAHAIPMRLRGTTIGTMNLFDNRVGPLRPRDAAVAQAMADVATIGILQERVASHATLVAEQLQRALDSRVLIEQAKGAVSQARGVSIEDAFTLLRTHARSHNQTLRGLAAGIVDRTVDPGVLGTPRHEIHD